MKIRIGRHTRLVITLQHTNGWNIYDNRGVVHWAADGEQMSCIAYLRGRGWFSRRERVWL